MVTNSALALRREYREWKERKRLDPARRLAHRKEMKEDIAKHLAESGSGPWREGIIRDTARMDDYPEPDESAWGISPAFKVELKGQYHRGLEALLKLEEVAFEGKVARAVKSDEPEEETVGIVGRIPYDSIVSIDWSGDEYNPQPHFYCWFEHPEGPYESIEVYRMPTNSHGYWERLDVRYKPRKYSRLSLWQNNRRIKRAQREFDREFGDR